MREIKLNNNAQYDELILEKVRIGLSEYISKEQILNFNIEIIGDNLTDSIIFKIRGFLMGEKLREEKRNWRVSYPSSWWQMLKEQYFPKWLLKKYPVKYTIKKRKVTFKVYEVYPKLPIAIPKYTDSHFPLQICYEEDIINEYL